MKRKTLFIVLAAVATIVSLAGYVQDNYGLMCLPYPLLLIGFFLTSKQ